MSYTTLPASALPLRDEVPPSDANVAGERPGVVQREDGCGEAAECHGTPSGKHNSRLVIQAPSREATGALEKSSLKLGGGGETSSAAPKNITNK